MLVDEKLLMESILNQIGEEGGFTIRGFSLGQFQIRGGLLGQVQRLNSLEFNFESDGKNRDFILQWLQKENPSFELLAKDERTNGNEEELPALIYERVCEGTSIKPLILIAKNLVLANEG